MTKKLIMWADPATGTCSAPVVHLCDPKTASQIVQEAHPDASDDVALNDFMVTNWAEWVDAPEWWHEPECRAGELTRTILANGEAEEYPCTCKNWDFSPK